MISRNDLYKNKINYYKNLIEKQQNDIDYNKYKYKFYKYKLKLQTGGYNNEPFNDIQSIIKQYNNIICNLNNTPKQTVIIMNQIMNIIKKYTKNLEKQVEILYEVIFNNCDKFSVDNQNILIYCDNNQKIVSKINCLLLTQSNYDSYKPIIKKLYYDRSVLNKMIENKTIEKRQEAEIDVKHPIQLIYRFTNDYVLLDEKPEYTLKISEILQKNLANSAYIDSVRQWKINNLNATYDLYCAKIDVSSSSKNQISLLEYLSTSKGVGGQIIGFNQYYTGDNATNLSKGSLINSLPALSDSRPLFVTRLPEENDIKSIGQIYDYQTPTQFPIQADQILETSQIDVKYESRKIKIFPGGSAMPPNYANYYEIDFVGNFSLYGFIVKVNGVTNERLFEYYRIILEYLIYTFPKDMKIIGRLGEEPCIKSSGIGMKRSSSEEITNYNPVRIRYE